LTQVLARNEVDVAVHSNNQVKRPKHFGHQTTLSQPTSSRDPYDSKTFQPFRCKFDIYSTRFVGGTATLSVDGAELASGNIDKVFPIAFSTTETMDLGTTVSLAYVEHAPFEFTGKIDSVVVNIV
jgi:hypothetical protein